MSEHHGHRERLRQRFERDSGMDSFAPHEALELLLTYAIPRKDTNPIAHRLIDHFGSLHAVLEAPADELTAVPEIGQRAAQLIHMLLPLFRLYENDRLRQRQTLDSYRLVRDYCSSLYHGVTVEKFYLLSLDNRLKLLDARSSPKARWTRCRSIPGRWWPRCCARTRPGRSSPTTIRARPARRPRRTSPSPAACAGCSARSASPCTTT